MGHLLRVGPEDAAGAAPPSDLWDRIAADAADLPQDTPTLAVEYHIDRHDVVVAIGGGWDVAAELGDAPELVGMNARPVLWDVMGDDGLTDLWRAIVSKVRATAHPVVVDLRCDAPDRRRWYRMTATPLEEQGVHFRSELTFEMERPEVPELRRANDADPDAPTITVCSWCNEAGDPSADSTATPWEPIEVVLSRHRLLERSSVAPVAFGLCPRCAEDMAAAHADDQLFA